MIDIHSHILPGIDDGARSLEESISIIQELASQGVTSIIATPHFILDTMYMSSRKRNLELLGRLKQALVDAHIDVNLYLGNELFIDIELADLLQHGVVSTMADSKYILVEFSLNEEYPNYEDILGNLIELGYKVILAHPERYALTQQDYTIIQRLHEMGILMQCNVGSFVGQYGKSTKKLAIRLAKEKMIFALGSDIHRANGRNRIIKAQKKLRKYYNERELNQIMVRNPGKIIGVV